MSHNGDLFSVRDDGPARPTFELTRRGYDKRQVDLHLARVDQDLAGLAEERDRAVHQVRELAAQLRSAQAELADLQQRPSRVDKASFRHLGPMVDQILALAEKQAENITETTAQRAANHRADAEKVLANAREQAAARMRELEEELSARRAEDDQAQAERRSAAQAELEQIRERADQMRAEGEAAHERAVQDATRINEQSAQVLERARAEAAALVQAGRMQAQQEMESARAQTQQEMAQWRGTVEQEISERQSAVEQELTRQRTAADQACAALHAEAQQYAAGVRRRADELAEVHQDQIAAVQEEIFQRQQLLSRLESELATGQQELVAVRQESTGLSAEVTDLRQQLVELRRDLAAEQGRLTSARDSADAAERHAKEVRARVQREAKRVADLAAAAVMAAAAGGGETGEYRVVPNPRAVAENALRQQTESAGSLGARLAGLGGPGGRHDQAAGQPVDQRPAEPFSGWGAPRADQLADPGRPAAPGLMDTPVGPPARGLAESPVSPAAQGLAEMPVSPGPAGSGEPDAELDDLSEDASLDHPDPDLAEQADERVEGSSPDSSIDPAEEDTRGTGGWSPAGYGSPRGDGPAESRRSDSGFSAWGTPSRPARSVTVPSDAT